MAILQIQASFITFFITLPIFKANLHTNGDPDYSGMYSSH